MRHENEGKTGANKKVLNILYIEIDIALLHKLKFIEENFKLQEVNVKFNINVRSWKYYSYGNWNVQKLEKY